MEKRLLLTKEKIIKQNRRLSRISAVFSINLFFAVILLFAAIFLLKEEIQGFAPLKIVGFLKSLNLLRILILTAILLAAIADIIVSAYFIKYFPKNRRDKIANSIKNTGKRDKGEIVKTEIYKKSKYEIIYKTVLSLEDCKKEVFCFYSAGKKEPSPLGERWRLYYDENSSFAVLTKRIAHKISETNA